MKNTRFTSGIIAFIGTFAISIGLVWLLFGFPVEPKVSNYSISSEHSCQQRHANAIYSFLQSDIRNGDERDRRSVRNVDSDENGEKVYSISLHADSVAQYVEEMNSLDPSEFPQDFQNAWNDHVNAWEDYSEFLNIKKDSSLKTNASKKEFSKLENPYSDEISRTWYKVLRIGRDYGAYIR